MSHILQRLPAPSMRAKLLARLHFPTVLVVRRQNIWRRLSVDRLEDRPRLLVTV